MKKLRVAINGFGRIGRQFFKVAFEKREIEVVAINDLGDLDNLAYLLEFDTVYGHYDKKIEVKESNLIVDNKKIKYVSEPEPSKLPWKDLDIDVVVESTGRFTSYEKAKLHLDAGAKRVVLSAPIRDGGEAITATPNVNEKMLAEYKVSTNASCTTNAATPAVTIMMAKPGIKYGLINTVHGYTAEQSLVDGPMPPLHKDLRRGRAAAANIVPTTSGVSVSVIRAIPEMKDRFDGMAMRVPVVSGSILDLTFIAEQKTSIEEINSIFTEESKKPEWQGILAVTDKALVSSDIIKNPHGAIVDLNLTRVIGGELVKVMVWYDNEWGYANMLARHVLSLAPFIK